LNYTTFSNVWSATTNPSRTTYNPYVRWNTATTSNGYSDPWRASYEVRYDPPTPKKPRISTPPNDDGKELFTDEELSELLDS